MPIEHLDTALLQFIRGISIKVLGMKKEPGFLILLQLEQYGHEAEHQFVDKKPVIIEVDLLVLRNALVVIYSRVVGNAEVITDWGHADP